MKISQILRNQKQKESPGKFKVNKVSVLDFSDNKIGDKVGIKLLETLLSCSRVTKLNLNKTLLGYKTGCWLLRRLSSGSLPLRILSLKFNGGISTTQKYQITQLLEEQEMESVRELGNKQEKYQQEWVESVCATHRNVLQQKDSTARHFGRHSHSPQKFKETEYQQVSINQSPDMAVVQFQEYRPTRASRSVYPSHSRQNAQKSIKSVPKGPMLARSQIVEEKPPDICPQPLDDDSFFEPIYNQITFQAQTHNTSPSPEKSLLKKNSPSPQKIHPFYAKNKSAIMAKVNNLLKSKGPPRALQVSPPPSIRPQSQVPKASDFIYLSSRRSPQTVNPHSKRKNSQASSFRYAPSERVTRMRNTPSSLSMRTSAISSSFISKESKTPKRQQSLTKSPIPLSAQIQQQQESITVRLIQYRSQGKVQQHRRVDSRQRSVRSKSKSANRKVNKSKETSFSNLEECFDLQDISLTNILGRI